MLVLLELILTGKGINRAGEGHSRGIVRVGYGSNPWSQKNI